MICYAPLPAEQKNLTGKTEFAELALKSMCTLLTEATHFNFRTNLINAIVMRLSKKSWDKVRMIPGRLASELYIFDPSRLIFAFEHSSLSSKRTTLAFHPLRLCVC
jgi:hypothetical protein